MGLCVSQDVVMLSRRFLFVLLASFSSQLPAATYPLPAPDESVIGEISYVETKYGDTLLDIGRRNGVGYDKVDLAAATKHGVAVTITPEGNHGAVAEHALALMMSLIVFDPMFGSPALHCPSILISSDVPMTVCDPATTMAAFSELRMAVVLAAVGEVCC